MDNPVFRTVWHSCFNPLLMKQTYDSARFPHIALQITHDHSILILPPRNAGNNYYNTVKTAKRKTSNKKCVRENKAQIDLSQI